MLSPAAMDLISSAACPLPPDSVAARTGRPAITAHFGNLN